MMSLAFSGPAGLMTEPIELEHLLERRAVRGAERVRDDARHETSARGGTAPRRRIGALCRGQLANGLIERRPERRPACIQRPVAAVRQLERSSHSLTKECAQVLVDERLTCETVQTAHGVELAEQVAVHRPHHCLRDRSPHRVHDHCAGVVVAAVEIGVEARCVAPDPVVEDVQRLGAECTRRGTASQNLADDRPHGRARVFGGGPVHHADDVGQLHVMRELVEQLDAMDGAERGVVTVHEARRRLIVPVE